MGHGQKWGGILSTRVISPRLDKGYATGRNRDIRSHRRRHARTSTHAIVTRNILPCADSLPHYAQLLPITTDDPARPTDRQNIKGNINAMWNQNSHHFS